MTLGNFLRGTLALLGCFFLLGVPVARAEFFEIDDYVVSIQITDQSELQVEEVIDVRFLEPRHGIFRAIPTTYKTASLGGTFTTLVYDISVPGEQWSSHTDGPNMLVKIGNPAQLVSGNRRYTIRYKVFGAIEFREKFSEFYWNAIGLEWDVPIHKASVSVRVPKELALTGQDYLVYTGHFGSTASDTSVSWQDQTLTVLTTRSLQPKEGVTIAIKFPPGFLADGDSKLRLRLWFTNYGIVLLPIVAFIVLYRLWRVYGRDDPLPHQVFYHPPKDLTPLEVGMLQDNNLHIADITGLIVQWAVSGYISVREVTESGLLLTTKDLELTKRAPLPPEARRYEHLLFDKLFSQGETVLLGSSRNEIISLMGAFQLAVKNEIKKLSLYDETSLSLRTFLSILAFLSLIPLGIAKFSGSVGLVPITIVLTGVLLAIFGRIMPRKSSRGRALYQQINGFKEFMTQVQAPQLQKLLAEDPMYFDKTLPFAVVFGLGSAWTSHFQSLMGPPPAWLVGASGKSFATLMDFCNSLDAGLQVMSSAFGSGSSGSGGGRGGGGGGSW